MGAQGQWPSTASCSIPGTILGFAAAGHGVATLVPAAMHTADELPGLRPGTLVLALSKRASVVVS
ncbi:hypothetical protein [Arthrobacter globiformis]|uniref:hypothetical protein n=1 Tax=Arthrobacter globiformis TaxID=1665 RepID=UPI00278CE536|nr:hypothetical protein [Arthrobacter globiformis]MDQ0620522.1 hypothetical protein [Arthrobacter globiformis]